MNEDKVREFATHVRNFATDIDGAHNAELANPHRVATIGWQRELIGA